MSEFIIQSIYVTLSILPLYLLILSSPLSMSLNPILLPWLYHHSNMSPLNISPHKNISPHTYMSPLSISSPFNWSSPIICQPHISSSLYKAPYYVNTLYVTYYIYPYIVLNLQTIYYSPQNVSSSACQFSEDLSFSSISFHYSVTLSM